MGFDKELLEKLGSRKKLTARGEIIHDGAVFSTRRTILITAEKRLHTLDSFSLTFDSTVDFDSLANKDLSDDNDSFFYNGRQKPPSTQHCVYSMPGFGVAFTF